MMANEQHAADYSEDFLWVRGVGHPDHLTVIGRERLYHLSDGAAPNNEAEQVLVHDPQWFDVYLRYVIGEFPITLAVGKPLPAWIPAWLGMMRAVDS
jgi:hypothetical protein